MLLKKYMTINFLISLKENANFVLSSKTYVNCFPRPHNQCRCFWSLPGQPVHKLPPSNNNEYVCDDDKNKKINNF